MATLRDRVRDGLANVLSGLGTSQHDKRLGNQWLFAPIDQMQVDAAYRSSWVVRKIHDLPPYDMTRAWRAWQADDDVVDLIKAEEKRLRLRTKYRRVLLVARMCGGAAIVMGTKDSDYSKPLDPESVGEGGLLFANVLSRYQITEQDFETDATLPEFGEPRSYSVSGKTIHASRVIPFIGQPLPALTGQTLTGFWGDPLLQSIRDACDNSETAANAVASLLQEMKTDFIRVPGLMSKLATADFEQTLVKRFSQFALGKSMFHIGILDKDEEWETREASFQAMPDVIRTYYALVSGAADIPATRLLSQAPAGMNATGESDLRNYYDMIAARQAGDLEETVSPLDDLVIRSATGKRDPDIHFRWNPLWQLTPQDKATVDKQRADTAKVWGDSGLIPSQAIATAAQNQLVEDGTFSGLRAALDDAEAAGDLAPIAEPTPVPGQIDPATGLPIAAPPAAGGNVIQLAKAKAAGMKDAVSMIFGDAQPRTLYVSRAVLNAAEIIAWAKAQGFATTVPADEMHVTVMFSRTPVDWIAIGADDFGGVDAKGELLVPPGGPRIVEQLGPKGAIVLMFANWQLAYRHGRMRDVGASWDWPEYQPHITITYDGAGMDLAGIEPYRGPIRLGPEIFAEVVDDWETGLKEQ